MIFPFLTTATVFLKIKLKKLDLISKYSIRISTAIKIAAAKMVSHKLCSING